MTCGADKTIVQRTINPEALLDPNWKRNIMNNIDDVMPISRREVTKNKIFSMDIANYSQYVATGHDKLIQLWQLSNLDRVWEKKPESIRKIGTQDQIKIIVDTYCSIVVSSSSDKFISIYEASSGHLLCRASCGEITTAMCFSSNMKHLITASADGVIYVWKIPENVNKALQKVIQDMKMKEK